MPAEFDTRLSYSLARPELLDLLASAELLLDATGQAVTLCPNYGIDARPGGPTSVGTEAKMHDE